MPKSILYIMCGLPFSGKSTLAYAIADYLKCEHYCLPEVFQRNPPWLNSLRLGPEQLALGGIPRHRQRTTGPVE